MKMMIIGAGATAHSKYANPDRRPPMSTMKYQNNVGKEKEASDLSRFGSIGKYSTETNGNVALDIKKINGFFRGLIPPCHYTNESNMRFHSKPWYFFTTIFELYTFKDKDNNTIYDIEGVFTGLYALAYNLKIEDPKLEKLKEIVTKHLGVNNFKTNILNQLDFYSAKLYMEINRCLGTKGENPSYPSEIPVCPWHQKLASELNTSDVVVNFNYDSVMAAALLNEKKLSRNSFLNIYIEHVNIPTHLISQNPIILINPHGSFTWFKRNKCLYETKELQLDYNLALIFKKISENKQVETDEKKYFIDQVLNPGYISVNITNIPPPTGSLHNLILPLKKKKNIFDFFPVFKAEYESFLEKLGQADEVYLVGKNFNNSDQDIAEDIKDVCSKKTRKMVYIDLQSKNEDWVEYHDEIFNSTSNIKYDGFKEYYEKEKLNVLA